MKPSTQSLRWLPLSIFSCLLFFALIIVYSPQHIRNNAASALQQAAPAVKTVVSIATVTATATRTATVEKTLPSKPAYTSGEPVPGYEYSKGIIVASVKKENTSWVADRLPDFARYIYVNDDPEAEFTVPKNHGNELMAYLTFIIDHYDKLPEIMFFVHAHERTFHNPAIFDYSTPNQIKAINLDRVVREGYMNINCGDWDTGKCPAYIRPSDQEPGIAHLHAFRELFPEYHMPQILGAACCSQFAVTKERMLQIPLEKWNRYRDWLLKTEEGDPGYIWEYVWQFLLKGELVHCPAAQVCYCDGYHICFGGHHPFEDYMALERSKETMIGNARALDKQEEEAKEAGRTLSQYDVERRVRMRDMIKDLDEEIARRREAAWERGKDPELRAMEKDL